MNGRMSVWEWAKRYTGDPDSWKARGAAITDFLLEEGLSHVDQVLEVGCGNLSQGRPLIEHLDAGRYCGVDPNGWLIEAALQQFPHLVDKEPRFSFRDDFDASEFGATFDFAVAHSVLSHVAHWQMELALSRIRTVVRERGVFLASLRLADENSFATDWVYPGVSFFRLDTLKVLGFHTGWLVDHMPDYRERLVKVAPNDFHDWVRFTAIPSAEEQNHLRAREHWLQIDERELGEISREILRDRQAQRQAELDAAARAGACEEER